MNSHPSERVQKMEISATLAMAAKARELKNEGKDIIGLSLGEPDFTIPEFIKESAKQAIDDNYNSYSPVDGYADLKQAIALKFKRDKEKLHPTQKPLDLIKYLINTYSNEGDWVLDNTCGSDTTGIASFELGRNSISIENDLSIYKLAKKRREEKNIITADMNEPIQKTGT